MIDLGHTLGNAGERTRTSTGFTPLEPKSSASASSATPAAKADTIIDEQ
jgi:hypothetical protein